MPWLYCPEHGRECEATCEADRDYYRFLGETVLIVRGTMKTASLHCDRCRLRLRRGWPGWLVTAFPRHLGDGPGRYDYRREAECFRPGSIEARLYGAVPPHGFPSPPAGLADEDADNQRVDAAAEIV